MPHSWIARPLQIGTAWRVLNVGIRIRQIADAPIDWVDGMAATNWLAFGLQVGAANGYGSGAHTFFAGVRTSGAWTRAGGQSGWTVPLDAIADWNASSQTAAAASAAFMPVTARNQTRNAAMYCRFTKGPVGLIVQPFWPLADQSPNAFDFEMQMQRASWSRSLCRHHTHRSTSLTLTGALHRMDQLDSVAVASSLKDDVAGTLRGMELVEIRAEILE